MAYSFDNLCAHGAQLLRNLPDVNREALLWAIGGAESSWGKWNVTRYERAFGWGGRYADKKLLRKFGDLAASSIGPWQVMFPNAWAITSGTVTPQEMMQPEVALLVTVDWMNERVIDRGAWSVPAIADAWNSGTHRDSFVPHKYVAKVQKYYDQRVKEA